MLRISVVQSSSQAMTLHIEGDVRGRWIEELRRSCEEALSRGTQLTLDLAGVSFIDGEGIGGFHGGNARSWLLAIVRNTYFRWLTAPRFTVVRSSHASGRNISRQRGHIGP